MIEAAPTIVQTSEGSEAEGGYLAWYAAASLALLLLLGSFNWAVDPLQFYRRAAYSPVFSPNQRYQNPGLARSYDYETIVIGTSHSENFLPSRVAERLGESAVKLAISGATAREQFLVANMAIETGQVKHVLWALNYLSFDKPALAVSRKEGEFPTHLYVEGPETLSKYLLSLDTAALSAKALLGLGERDLDTLNTWYRESEFSASRALADWHRRGAIIDRLNRIPGVAYQSSRTTVRRSVRANLLSLIKRHPEIRFDLFFPPYSILLYLSDHRAWEHSFAERQAYKSFVVSQASRFANVRIFDFQGIQAITHDLDNYKDLEHFDIDVNDYILESIALGRDLVLAEHYAQELKDQAEQVEAYRRKVCSSRGPRRELCPRVARP